MFSIRVLILAVVLMTASRANALTITSCGTTIPDGTVGTLGADLTCTDPTPAVTLGAGATLELAGHKVEGAFAGSEPGLTVVSCAAKKCTILGPGEIAGNGVASYRSCVAGPQDGKLQMTADGQGTIDVHGCSLGIIASTAKLADVTAHGCSYGVYAPRAKLADVNASGNDTGIWTQKGKLQNITADTNSGFGVVGAGVSKVRLRDSEVAGNGDAGVLGDSVALRDTTVTGNNGIGQLVDIVTYHMPRLMNVTCAKSGRLSELYTMTSPPALNGTWSVCSGD